MTRKSRVSGLAATAIVSVATLSACSSSGSPTSGTPAASSPPGTASVHIGELKVTGGYIPKPASPDVAAAYFTVTNSGSKSDSLTKVSSNVTSTVMAMAESHAGGTGSMTDLTRVLIPAHGSFRSPRATLT